MGLNTFGIFSVLTAAAMVTATSAEARIRRGMEPKISAGRAKVSAQLQKITYKPGSYVVRAIDFDAKANKFLTDISPKILTLDVSLARQPRVASALYKSLTLSKKAAQDETQNTDLSGLLYIVVNAQGTVTVLRDLSTADGLSKSEVEKVTLLVKLKKMRTASINRPFNVSSEYSPSILSTDVQLNELYNDVDLLNQDYMDLNDNCYNRSHYWARSNEIGVKGTNTKTGQVGGLLSSRRKVSANSIHSEKVFVMFTSRYQREFKHKWWYHTAPTVRVTTSEGAEVDSASGEKFERYVLDRSYTDEPMTVEEWVYTFAGHADPNGKIKCKRLKNLGEFYEKSETEYCFWFEGANMYTHTPNDLTRPNSEKQWTCESIYSVMNGVPYPKLPYGPRAKNASVLKLDGEEVEYNDYVVSEENQAGWSKVNNSKFIPDFCRQ